MFFNIKICVLALSLSMVVVCDENEENIKVRSTKRSPIHLDIENEPYTNLQAALEENTPKGRSDPERKITARKGVPNEVPDLNDTTPEPLPSDVLSDREKIENELHVTTGAPPLIVTDNETGVKHRPREGVDVKSPEIDKSTVSIDSNDTKNPQKSINESTKNGINSTKLDPTIKTSAINATKSINNINVEQSNANTSTNHNSATTTTIATTTNTTVITPAPAPAAPTTPSATDKKNKKKTTSTYVGDQVELEHKTTTTKTSGKLSVDEPFAQLSKETKTDSSSSRNGGGGGSHRDYIIPVVALIFIIPIILGALLISYRRLKDYWSTRHYRRMDFLVDGMYND